MDQYIAEQIYRERVEQMRRRADVYRITHTCQKCGTRRSGIRLTLHRVLGKF